MRLFIITLLAALLVPAAVFAFGGHEMLGCVGCHGIHDAKADIIFAVEANKQSVNPRTNKPFEGVTALCLGCHENTGGMGILPIAGRKSHPYGITPNAMVADVPSQLLRNNVFECVSCHDPHPSNPNHKYLRVDTAGGGKMQNFCSLCHSTKSGQGVPATAIFTSMDQKKGVTAPAPAPAAKPAK